MMRLPTNEEFDRAYEEWAADGLSPMAGCVDAHAMLNGTVGLMTDCVRDGQDLRTTIKSAVVTGLQLGIRIGENRK